MGKGQGKGQGKGKGGFHDFIDNSYFAFWFRQWAAFFIIVGIILIIVGAVVSSIYPSTQEKSYALNNLLTSPSSPTYESWSNKAQTLAFHFMDLDPSDATCTPQGPYLYDVTLTKADVTFDAVSSSVSYKLTSEKLFRPTGSAALVPIRSLNPRYSEFVSAKSGEENLLVDSYLATSLSDDLEKLFRTTAPKLIAARGIGQLFADSVKAVREDVIFPALFGNAGLKRSIDSYEIKYLVDKAQEKQCEYCVTTPSKGVYASLLNTFIDCRNSTNQDLEVEIVKGFPSLKNEACATYLHSHELNLPLWAGQSAVFDTLFDTIKGLNQLSLWYSPSDPSSLGHCNNRPAAASSFGVSQDFIDDFCDIFLESFFAENLPSFPRAELGARHFCTGPNDPSDPELTLFDGPSRATVQSLELPENLRQTTFESSGCDDLQAAMNDVDNFVIPVFNDDEAAPGGYSSQVIATLREYIHTFDLPIKEWYTELWAGAEGDYGCAGCTIRPLDQFADHTIFGSAPDFAKLVKLLFPETGSAGNLFTYALFHDDPKPSMLNPTLFSNITSATGILNFIYDLDREIYTSPLYPFSESQVDELQTYSNGLVENYLGTLRTNNGLGSNNENVGLLQFARAQLACGPKGTGRCSIQEFFGLSGFAPEFGIASYVTNEDPVYYGSFENTVSDQGLRDSWNHNNVNTLFIYLGTNSANDLINGEPNAESKKYFNYLLNTLFMTEYLPATSRAIASRLPNQWVNTFTDPFVANFGSSQAISPDFTLDMDYDVGVTMHSGEDDISKAYQYALVDGSAQSSTYGQAETISDLYNMEGLPPSVPTNRAVKFYDLYFRKSFTYVFSEKTTIRDISGTKGTAEASNWDVNANFGITTKDYLPVPTTSNVFYSPCTIDLGTCSFPSPSEPFSGEMSIIADLNTGFVTKQESCVVISATPSGSFPYTAPGVSSSTKYPMVRRMSVVMVTENQALDYSLQFSKVQDTGNAILIALVVVGVLFVVVGLVFIVFWLIRRQRKGVENAKKELVEDPFGEKKKDVVGMKY